ncbi:MAG: radical SAM protein [Asgard group archaeon]
MSKSFITKVWDAHLSIINYIFGPVHSRRLGRSLGICTLPRRRKICTYDCIYCEVGRTTDLVPPSFRLMGVNRAETFFLLESVMEKLKTDEHIETLTMVGHRGEPTLNPRIVEITEGLKKIRDKYRPEASIVILTNSSTITQQSVQEALTLFDKVIAKLDTASQKKFETINRPHEKVPSIEEIKDALVCFSKNHPGKLVIQTLVLKSPIEEANNSTRKDAEELAKAYREIKPESVQIYGLDRCPPEDYVFPLSTEEIYNFSKEIKKQCPNITLKTYP